MTTFNRFIFLAFILIGLGQVYQWAADNQPATPEVRHIEHLLPAPTKIIKVGDTYGCERNKSGPCQQISLIRPSTLQLVAAIDPAQLRPR